MTNLGLHAATAVCRPNFFMPEDTGKQARERST
jgi:hypothetical protein